jgi:hypothetical protein
MSEMNKLASIIVKPVEAALGVAGLRISRVVPRDQPSWIRDIIRKVTPFTATSPERVASLCQAVSYVVKNNIEGDIVECGVWKGGSIMAAAFALIFLGDTSRTLYLFDTFEGMSEPTEADLVASTKQSAQSLMHTEVRSYSPIEEVRENIKSVRYPGQIVLVKGKVEDTIPYNFQKPFAILRLDTDWYESTRHELNHLYPRLAKGGVLIIDDYGHWEGARKAVDEYIDQNRLPVLLNRIDYTGRIAIKLL